MDKWNELTPEEQEEVNRLIDDLWRSGRSERQQPPSQIQTTHNNED